MTESPDRRLVDAAPDLLQALRVAAEFIQMVEVAEGSFDADVRRMVLRRARAVIRQATGEDGE